MLVSAVTGRVPRLLRLLRRAAPAPAQAPLALCPPSRGLAGVRNKALASTSGLCFFVKCEGDAGFAKVTVPASSDVSELIEAALGKLRIDVSPSAATLSPAAAAPGSLPLDPTLLLTEALAAGALAPRAKLLLTIHAKASPPPPPPPPLNLALFDNVLVRGPDYALDAHLLATLSAAGTNAHVRVAALSALVADVVARDACALISTASLPLFDTVAHASLLTSLAGHARLLSGGGFVGSNGVACRTLVGARGIGKTVMLRAFAAVAASAFPGVTVLYVSGEGIKSDASSFQSAHLGDVIKAAARASGADAAAHSGPFALHAALRHAGTRVLLILDEVDELYRVTEADGAAQRHVLSSLGTLAVLGGGTTGLFGVLACGSSASTHALICADVAHLVDKFPLIRAGVPDLNDTKFRRLAIEMAPCSRSGEVANILAASAGLTVLPDAALPLARLVTFFVGVAPRAIQAAVQECMLSAPPKYEGLSPSARMLYSALLAQLVVKNSDLLALVLTPERAIDLDVLRNPACDWERAVAPLDWSSVEGLWAAAAEKHSLPLALDGGFLERLVSDLSDAHLIHIERTPDGTYIWPTTAAQIAVSAALPGMWYQRAAEKAQPLMTLLQGAASAASVLGKLLSL